MSTYLTPYNIAIANQQKGFDVRNLKHDAYEASQTPLRGGQVQGDSMREGDYQLEGGDFWSDFADGFMSVMRPVGQVASAIAPFIPKGAGASGGMACRCPPRGRCRCGSGLSGGDEITDAEPAIMNPDLNSTGMFHGFGTSGGYNQNVSGMGMSGGDFLSDLGNIASTVAPFLPLLGLGRKSSSAQRTKAVGRALLGTGFFDDLLDGLNKVGNVAAAVAPHVKTGMDIYGKFGKGTSGGANGDFHLLGKKLLSEMKALHGRGLSGGDFDWSTLASFAPLLLGLGLSGGEDEPDMSYLEPFLEGFGMSGGSFIDDLISGINNALGKVGDFVEGSVNKIGDLVEKGAKATSDGLDKVMPVVEKVGKIADTAGKVAGLFSGKKGEGMSGGALGQRYGNASDTRKLSGKQQLYKGGNIPNDGQAPFNTPPKAGMSGGDMSVNAPYIGFDTATGKDFKRPVGGSSAALVALQQRANVNQPYMTGDGQSGGRKKLSEGRKPAYKVKQGDYCCLTSQSSTLPCNGVPLTKAFMNDYKKRSKGYSTYRQGAGQAGNSESLDQIEATNALVNELAASNPAVNTGAGASGGKRPASKWIEHVKAYSKAHGVSYKQALKDAKATYRGAGTSGGGTSGGDFWSDLGNVASTVAPFLPLLL
jgi:hypothetical protein